MYLVCGYGVICKLPCHAHAGLRDGGHLWLRFFLSFLLDKKGPKNQGRHHRTLHTKRTWLVSPSNHPAMSAGPTRPTRSVFGIPTHGVRCYRFLFLTARSHPLPSSRAFPLSKGVPEGRGIKVPRSPTLLGTSPAVPRQRPRGPSTAARGS